MNWTQARTPDDFGECTALWLEGRLKAMPTKFSFAKISPETKRIVPYLTHANRSGKLLTAFSQPGCTREDRSYGGISPEQRAMVMGFVPVKYVGIVKAKLGRLRGINLQVARPGKGAFCESVQVTRGGRYEVYYSCVGSPADIAERYGPGQAGRGLHADLIKALQKCCQIIAVDTEWGRNILWLALKRL